MKVIAFMLILLLTLLSSKMSIGPMYLQMRARDRTVFNQFKIILKSLLGRNWKVKFSVSGLLPQPTNP